jgi:hypothetical protein
VFPAELTPEDSFGLPVTERPNHDSRLLLRHVKHNAVRVILDLLFNRLSGGCEGFYISDQSDYFANRIFPR